MVWPCPEEQQPAFQASLTACTPRLGRKIEERTGSLFSVDGPGGPVVNESAGAGLELCGFSLLLLTDS